MVRENEPLVLRHQFKIYPHTDREHPISHTTSSRCAASSCSISPSPPASLDMKVLTLRDLPPITSLFPSLLVTVVLEVALYGRGFSLLSTPLLSVNSRSWASSRVLRLPLPPLPLDNAPLPSFAIRSTRLWDIRFCSFYLFRCSNGLQHLGGH